MNELTDRELGAATRVDLHLSWRPASTPENQVRFVGRVTISPDNGHEWLGDLQVKLDNDGNWFVDELDVPEGYVDEDDEEPWLNWVSSEVEALLNRDPGVELLRRRFGQP